MNPKAETNGQESPHGGSCRFPATGEGGIAPGGITEPPGKAGECPFSGRQGRGELRPEAADLDSPGPFAYCGPTVRQCSRTLFFKQIKTMQDETINSTQRREVGGARHPQAGGTLNQTDTRVGARTRPRFVGARAGLHRPRAHRRAVTSPATDHQTSRPRTAARQIL